MENEELARKLYNMATDMDWADYDDTQEEEISQLEAALNELENSQDDNLQVLYRLLEILEWRANG